MYKKYTPYLLNLINKFFFDKISILCQQVYHY